jgi:UDP-2,3-diacylglucosamine pyrophosphatase LpxH
MGARFDVSHLNLVGYLTDDKMEQSIRTDRETLASFLEALAYRKNLISVTERSSEDWTQIVANIAKQQLFRLNAFRKEFEDSLGIDPASYLDPLKPHFTGYDFYALILPSSSGKRDHDVFYSFVEFGLKSGAHGLVLLPNQGLEGGLSQFIDPFPIIKSLADHPIAPPAVAFWTSNGGACVLNLDDAARFFRQSLLPSLPKGVAAVDQAILGIAENESAKRILHLSDLHFGLDEAGIRRSYLKRHLQNVVPKVDRVVVTGDLFDSPSENLRSSFDEFRNDIEAWTPKPILVVPGNHDMRKSGNAFGGIGRAAEYVTDLEWSPFEIDSDLKALFFSFNSSESGNFARGRVSMRQRLDRAEKYEIATTKSDEVAGYFKIALVHHHPVAYGSQPTSLYEKLLARIGGEERFIAFEESEEFLKWCYARGVNLVLHGHKHVPRLTSVQKRQSGTIKELTLVGCGSTVGAGGKPMCYDVVTFNPTTKRWSTTFHHDVRGDGSGFEPQNIVLDFRSLDD